MAVLVLQRAGCTSPGANQPPPVTTPHLADYRITPVTLTLDAGIYTFTATNGGTISHAPQLTG